MTPYPQQTIHYRTFVKTAMVLGLRQVFAQHPDPNLQWTFDNDGKEHGVRVTLDSPTKQVHFPSVVVKFYGRNIQSIGVGHEEVIDAVRYQHYWYDGDIALEIHALDQRSVDYISNSIVQTITVGSLEHWTNELFHQLYELTANDNPDAANNSLTINSDKISEFGESKEPVPWTAEDSFVYRNSYRVGCVGEYYSVPLSPELEQIINHVYIYPYDSQAGEALPSGSVDPAPWLNL